MGENGDCRRNCPIRDVANSVLGSGLFAPPLFTGGIKTINICYDKFMDFYDFDNCFNGVLCVV
jgi:hypothetical protein